MAERKVTENINIEGAKLIFRNFTGKPGDYNRDGGRSFGVILDDELAEHLKKDGWNVKYRKPDSDGYCQPYLNVKVKFDYYPPIAMMINSVGKTRLNEDNIGELDYCIPANVDVIIRPYNYPATNGRPAGVSAYLKAIYVTIQEDQFAKKYASIPDLDIQRQGEESK